MGGWGTFQKRRAFKKSRNSSSIEKLKKNKLREFIDKETQGYMGGSVS